MGCAILLFAVNCAAVGTAWVGQTWGTMSVGLLPSGRRFADAILKPRRGRSDARLGIMVVFRDRDV